MKHIVLIISAILFFQKPIIAQIDFLAPNIKVDIIEQHEHSAEEIVLHADDKFFYTGSDKIFGKYNKSTFKAEWTTELPSKIKYKDKKLEYFASYYKEGQSNLICTSYNSKSNRIEIFHAALNGAGEIGNYTLLSYFRTPKKQDYQLELIDFKKDLVFIASTGKISNNNQNIFAIWIDNTLSEKRKLQTQIKEKSDNLESWAFDPINDRVFATTHEGYTSSSFGVKKPKVRYMIGFDAKTEEIFSKKISMDNFTVFNTAVSVNPFSGDVHMIGFSGPKKSDSMNAIYDAIFDMSSYSFSSNKVHPITENAVQELVDSKTKMENMAQDANEVSFKLKDIYYSADGRYYVVFENRISSEYYRGHLILGVNKEDTFMKYVGNFGLRNNNAFINADGNLKLFTINRSKYLAKLYPSAALEGSTLKSFSLMEITVSKTGSAEIEILANLCSDTWYPYLTSWEQTGEMKDFHYYVTGMNKTTLFQFTKKE